MEPRGDGIDPCDNEHPLPPPPSTTYGGCKQGLELAICCCFAASALYKCNKFTFYVPVVELATI